MLILFLTLALRTAAADEFTSVQNKVRWSDKMQGLYKTLASLLTDVSSDKRFFDPVNKVRIEREAQQLTSLAHDLNQKGSGGKSAEKAESIMTSVDADPTIPLVAGLLSRESKRAVTEFKRGHREYARSILRSIPSYCIACHTRNASGPQFAELPIEPSSSSLTTFERGEFYAASRQFDRAQQEFIHVIKDSQTAGNYNFDWESAIGQSLAIAVRVKQDPKQALEIIQDVLDTKNGPLSVKENAKVWKTSVQQWIDEPRHLMASEEERYNEVLRLMAKAQEAQKYPIDRTADIYYLRASAATHNLLQADSHGIHVGEALLLAGVAYEVLHPIKTEDLHELYYEACIQRSPHTAIASLCFQRYEQSTIYGFTGSSGTDLPFDIRMKILELRTLSQPLNSVIE
jgi:hypothetical protein